jgi:YfiH family protein
VEEVLGTTLPAWVHPEWASTFPWLVQGTTTRSYRDSVLDFRAPGGADSSPRPGESWRRLLSLTRMTKVAYSGQVHEADVRLHGPTEGGSDEGKPYDGHVTERVGVLLGVTVADCVPVFVVSSAPRAIAVLHAGWRGAARGILERGLEMIGRHAGVRSQDLLVHLGPAICGNCYEVGPEVFSALGGATPPARRLLDLRGVLAARAVAAGVDSTNVTVSAHCTRCTGSDLFSHRGGDDGRGVGYLGIRR